MLTYTIYFFALIIFSLVLYLAVRALNIGLEAKNNFIKKNIKERKK
jgi:hypothetical protein